MSSPLLLSSPPSYSPSLFLQYVNFFCRDLEELNAAAQKHAIVAVSIKYASHFYFVLLVFLFRFTSFRFTSFRFSSLINYIIQESSLIYFHCFCCC